MVLSPAQLRALQGIARGDLAGLRSVTVGVLVARGLVEVRYVEGQESYRPSRFFSPTRWTRRVQIPVYTLTAAGRAELANAPH